MAIMVLGFESKMPTVFSCPHPHNFYVGISTNTGLVAPIKLFASDVGI